MAALPSSTRPRYLLVCPRNLDEREARLAGVLAAAGELILALPGAGDAPGAEEPAGARLWPLRSLGKMRPEAVPHFVIYASPPTPAVHWRVWWWKRRRAPESLLGGYWNLSADDSGGRWRRWLARWACDSLDFWLVESAAAGSLEWSRVPPRRCLVLTGDLSGVPEFLECRRRAEAHSVLWVDDDLSLGSPSTKHLVYSLPYLQATGWEVRGWCTTADESARAGAEVHTLPPAPAWLRLFSPYWFFVAVNLHGLWQTLLKGRPPARVVHTVGSAFLGADIVAIHFVHHLWLRQQFALRPRTRKAWLELGWTILAMGRDQLQYRNPRCRLFLPVSDSIAVAVRRVCLPRAEVEVLPNSYDETRFNPEVRARWREPMRRELDFTGEDFVFGFASQGHYRRKGFWRAVDALQRLRGSGKPCPGGKDVWLLVVGGHAATLDGLRRELDTRAPDWRTWVTFTGSQPEIERYLSAADAFLFPSYFEAFCLAEIENGALGLPLLLTRHPGTEMILRDGINGRFLEDDPAKMADTLASFVQDGLAPFAASPGRALTRAAYAQVLAGYYERFLDDGQKPGSKIIPEPSATVATK